MSGKTRSWIAIVPIMIALSTAGCATKKYVRTQTGIVDQRVTQIQAQTNEQFAKQQSEISRVDERVTTVDNRVTAVASAAQDARSSAANASASAAQANNAAAQAMQAAQSNASKIDSNSTEIVKLVNSQNYALVETANVTFKFNRSELTDEAKVALDLLVQKAVSQPHTVLEIEGFTDDIGARSYNLELSQKRAESVARYLVSQNVSLKSLSVIGLGEERAPEQLKAEFLALDPNANTSDMRMLARRVRVRVYAPGSTTQAAPAAGGADSVAVQRQRP